ncbi:MAG: prepilin peptidase [Caldilineales bacterium]|nr:prepilin peptidase [Caldilineales bacterium]
MNESLLSSLLLALWLIPCALFDWRQHRVPNWLTLPALPLALCWGWRQGTLALTLLVFAASYLAFVSGGMGGADGKLAIVQAAFAPAALAWTGLSLLITFILIRLLGWESRRLPAGPWFLAGSVLALLAAWGMRGG